MSENNVRAADPRNYAIPEGVSLFLRPKGSVDVEEWREVGSLVNVSMSPDQERLPHFSHRRGARAKDREVITQRTLMINFTLEEINLHNLQYAFGTPDDPAGATKDAKESKILANPGSGAGVIELGWTDVKNVVVRSVALDGAEVTYIENTDYTVNLANGEITPLGGGALANAVTVPEVHVYFEKAVTVQAFKLFTGQEVEVEAQFQILGDGGPKQIYGPFSNCILRNNGDIEIGDGSAWQSIPMTLEVLVNAAGEFGDGSIVDADQL